MSWSRRISFTESPNGISHGRMHALDPFAVQNFVGAGRNRLLETGGTDGGARGEGGGIFKFVACITSSGVLKYGSEARVFNGL